MGTTYPGQLAQSEQQISHYKQHTVGGNSEANHLYSIMLQVQLEDKSKKFI